VSEHDEKKELNRRTFLFQLAAMTASGSLLASCARRCRYEHGGRRDAQCDEP
jgi:hypothetical protein